MCILEAMEIRRIDSDRMGSVPFHIDGGFIAAILLLGTGLHRLVTLLVIQIGITAIQLSIECDMGCHLRSDEFHLFQKHGDSLSRQQSKLQCIIVFCIFLLYTECLAGNTIPTDKFHRILSLFQGLFQRKRQSGGIRRKDFSTCIIFAKKLEFHIFFEKEMPFLLENEPTSQFRLANGFRVSFLKSNRKERPIQTSRYGRFVTLDIEIKKEWRGFVLIGKASHLEGDRPIIRLVNL